MSINLKVEKKFTNILGKNFALVKEDFHRGAAELLPSVIKEVIQKGISPVQGTIRFQKYSQSYIDQIEGRVAFFKKNGKVISVSPTTKTVYNIRSGKTSKDSSKTGAVTKISIKKYQTNLGGMASEMIAQNKAKFNGKLKSPVNLTVTGKMLNSITSSYSADGAIIKFESDIAKYHNDIGVGKNRVIRPLLPNKSGQQFSALISKKIKDLLTKVLGERLG